MKLTVVFLTVVSLGISARGFSQTVTFSVKNASLEKVFSVIEQQTGYTFFYNNAALIDTKPVTASLKEMKLQKALKEILKGQELAYSIQGKTIFIHLVSNPGLLAPHEAYIKEQVQGIVLDSASARPLVGVTIQVKGTAAGTTTDQYGRFSISVDDQAVLEVSFIGYKTREIAWKGQRTITIKLAPSHTALDQLVVVGYGTSTRKDVTAAVSSISNKSLSDRTLFSLADAMKGEAAGLQIIQNDGTPGSGNTIRIRGASSVSAGSTPLYVVDGIIQNDIDDINPGAIESIDILKDASGTAQYGARGANGVIIITTKRGKPGRTRVEYYTNNGYQVSTHLYKLMNATQYARAKFLATGYIFTPADPNNPDQPSQMLPDYTYYRNTPLGTTGAFWGVSDSLLYHDWQNYASPDSTNTDWQRLMFQHAAIQEHRINISGGSEKSQFAVIGSYFNQGGLIVYSGYKRYNGRLNFEQKLSDNIRLNAFISAYHAVYDGFFDGTGSHSGVITSMLRQLPVNPVNITDLEDNEGVDGYITTNPYSIAKYATNKKYRDQLQSRMAFDWNLNNNLKLKVTGNYTLLNADNDLYYSKHISSGARSGGRALVSRGKITDLMNENLLYYKGKLGTDHRFKAMVGAIFEEHKTSTITAENQDFQVETLGVYGLGYGTNPIIPQYDNSTWRMASFLSRLEYNFKGKYLATVNMRSDGSSRFGRDNKWGYFPSASLAWRISEEPFMKHLQSVSFLKLRGSMGESGNTAIPSYLTLSTVTTSFSSMNGGPDADFGVIVDRPENASLKWETTSMINAGLDMGLFSDKISLTVEVYRKRTRNLLIRKVVPGYSGYDEAWTNFGSIQNSGMEATLNINVINTASLAWSLDGNIGFNRSKALDIGSPLNLDPGVVPGAGTSALIENGKSIGQWYGYKTEGIYKTEEDVKNSGISSIFGTSIDKIPPGYRKFVDENDDGVIDANDRAVLGRGEPLFSGGLSSTLSYKGISLQFLFQYSYGNKVYNANLLTLEKSNYNMDITLVNGWSPALYDMQTGAVFEKGNLNTNIPMPGAYTENFVLSNYIQDGSFLRLSDVTVSYNFPSKILDKLSIEQLEIFLTGKNLWLLTKYVGYDPEVNTGQGGFGDLMPSLDYASYPRSRVFSFGIDLKF